MKVRNMVLPAVNLILRQGEDVLLIRRQGSGFFDGWYSVPAGHIEAGEMARAALVRETLEEIGITIKEGDLSYVHTMHRAKPQGEYYVDFVFSATKWEGEPRNCEPNKCDDVQWFPLSALPANTIPYIAEIIRDAGKGVIYSELRPEQITPNPSESS